MMKMGEDFSARGIPSRSPIFTKVLKWGFGGSAPEENLLSAAGRSAPAQSRVWGGSAPEENLLSAAGRSAPAQSGVWGLCPRRKPSLCLWQNNYRKMK